jgi:hypothetical protein
MITMKTNNGPQLDKSRVYQNDIVTVVLLISRYVYVHHSNLYFSFCVEYHWNLIVLCWIFAYVILPYLLKLVGLGFLINCFNSIH